MSARGSLRASITAQIGHLTLAATLDTGAGTLALVGPNGGGKTTLLRALLGVVRCQRAHIEVGDVLLADTAAQLHVPVEQRGIAYVPQDYALFPHLSVRENVAFAVSSAARPGRTLSRKQLEVAVTAALASLEITSLAERRPDGLSGGERQRVALARALSVQPRALLLDEPLAALDVHARRDVRRFLADTLEALALPTLMVTHDPTDVRALASSIVVLENGKITQTGTWDELVAQPASRFVAEFVADPQR